MTYIDQSKLVYYTQMLINLLIINQNTIQHHVKNVRKLFLTTPMCPVCDGDVAYIIFISQVDHPPGDLLYGCEAAGLPPEVAISVSVHCMLWPAPANTGNLMD